MAGNPIKEILVTNRLFAESFADYPDCSSYLPFGSIPKPIDSQTVKEIPNRPVQTQIQIKENTHVEYVVPSMVLLPGSVIELGSSLDIQIAPTYQFCNTRGPGNSTTK